MALGDPGQLEQLQPATANPLMAAKFARQRANMTQPTSVMDERYPAWAKAQRQADEFLIGADLATAPLGLPKGAVTAGAKYAGRTLADLTEGHMRKVGMMPEIMIGPKAKLWNKDTASIAKDMEQGGATDREIWKATGNWRGPDAHWRQEISDHSAVFPSTPEVNALRDSLKWSKSGYVNGGPYQKFHKAQDRTLADLSGEGLGTVMKHDNAFDAYPSLRHIPVEYNPSISGGTFHSADGLFGTDQFIDLGFGNRGLVDMKSVPLHEIQHAIQNKEGWARGGNPTEFFKDSANETMGFPPRQDQAAWIKEAEALAMKKYRSLAGEAEARMTQTRMNMTPVMRRSIFPEDSYDVPIKSLIIKK